MTALTLATLVLLCSGAGPAQIVELVPADGAVVRSVPRIGAELDLTRGEPVDPASLRLLLDGGDVTGQARIVLTRDWPPSAVSISYSPNALPPGPHRAEIRMTTRAGRPLVIAWSFRLQPP